MAIEIDNLTAAVAANTSAANAAIANEQALKAKLDAALAANATLTAELAAAQSGPPAPDLAPVVAATGAIAASTQALADATTTTSPAN